MTDQHRAAFLEFDEDNDEKFSKPEVAELLLCMDKAARSESAVLLDPLHSFACLRGGVNR